MPQLDTSTWYITILSTMITLFILFQLKISKYYYYPKPEPSTSLLQKYTTPWEIKWTKICLPLLLPLQ